MSLHAERLRWIRESLRGAGGAPVSKRALCRTLGWPEARWKNLEGPLVWGDNSKAWVRDGLLALVARTTLPEEAGPRAVAYVMGESKEKPWKTPPAWREGQAPAEVPGGRPFKEPGALAPVVRLEGAPSVRRAQVETILRLLEAGQLDLAAAADEIDHVYAPRHYYNKHEAGELHDARDLFPDPDAA